MFKDDFSSSQNNYYNVLGFRYQYCQIDLISHEQTGDETISHVKLSFYSWYTNVVSNATVGSSINKTTVALYTMTFGQMFKRRDRRIFDGDIRGRQTKKIIIIIRGIRRTPFIYIIHTLYNNISLTVS